MITIDPLAWLVIFFLLLNFLSLAKMFYVILNITVFFFFIYKIIGDICKLNYSGDEKVFQLFFFVLEIKQRQLQRVAQTILTLECIFLYISKKSKHAIEKSTIKKIKILYYSSSSSLLSQLSVCANI